MVIRKTKTKRNKKVGGGQLTNVAELFQRKTNEEQARQAQQERYEQQVKDSSKEFINRQNSIIQSYSERYKSSNYEPQTRIPNNLFTMTDTVNFIPNLGTNTHTLPIYNYKYPPEYPYTRRSVFNDHNIIKTGTKHVNKASSRRSKITKSAIPTIVIMGRHSPKILKKTHGINYNHKQ